MFRPLSLGSVVPALLWVCSAPVAAQQFAVDDAGLVDRGGCQLEMWAGEASTWLLPACHLIPRTELTFGVGFVPEHGGRAWEWLAQGKVNLREAREGAVRVALVAGLVMTPLGGVAPSSVGGAYAYLPVSVAFGAERLILHGQVGWGYEAYDAGQHVLNWGARSDVALTARLVFIAEVFGEDDDGPDFQAGIRTALWPDRLTLALSWGGRTQHLGEGSGWTIGVAWTPPPWL